MTKAQVFQAGETQAVRLPPGYEFSTNEVAIRRYEVLIAGQARALGLTLVTSNRSECVRLPGLVVEDWTKQLP